VFAKHADDHVLAMAVVERRTAIELTASGDLQMILSKPALRLQ
jgi:hypothetical protein